ncbi:MAG: peptidoglycan-binding protein [Candidatus Paceibacterota bacterium]
MKKYILALFLVGFLLAPAFSFAQTGDVDPNPDTDPCVALQSSDLRYKSRDAKTNEEVSDLQDFLQSKGYLNNEPTGYFGILTLKAVKDFQRASSINPTGYVGSLTKAKIKDLSCDGTATSTNDTFAQCLSSKGLVLYGTSWCSHCNSQKARFGDSFKYVSYVECSNSVNSNQIKKCAEEDIHGYPTWININGTKYEGEQSLEKLSQISGCSLPGASNSNPTISVVSGPQTLKISETGKWTITASDSSGGNLTYSVKWGDENYKSSGTPVFSLEKDEQNTIFRHKYSKAGIYTPTFTVTNESGGSAQTSISVNVENTTSSSITILSPKAFESYHKGDRLPIDWTVSGIPPYVQGAAIDRKVTVELYKGGVLNRAMFYTPFTEDINNLSWLIGDEIKEGNDYQVNFIVKYKDVNGNEKTLQKKSDNFKIVSTTTPSITVLSPNGGNSINISDPLYVLFKTNNAYPIKHTINLKDETLDIAYVLNSLAGGDIFFTQEQIQQQQGQFQIVIPFITKSYNLNLNSKYKIEICSFNMNLNICDKSDNYFTITSATSSAPTLDFRNDNGTGNIPSGGSADLYWSSSNATSCIASAVPASSDWTGSKSVSAGGHLETIEKLTATTTFSLTCYNFSGGYVTKSVTVNVATPTTPSITILSPNGGEVYKLGQQITVRWKSVNIPANTLLAVNLFSNDPMLFAYLARNGTLNDGIETFTLPSTNSSQYIITIGTPKGGDLSNSALDTFDKSDNYFTISSSTPTLSGDVDGSGSINCADREMILQAYHGATLDAGQKTRADMDGDGKIDMNDVLLLTLRYNLSCNVSPAPDLIASTVADTTVTKGQNTTFYVDITNRGNASTGTTSFHNTFLLDNDTDHSTTVGNLGVLAGPLLAGGGKQTVSVSYAFPTAGTYYGRLCADEGTSLTAKTVTESDETNNCGNWTTIQVVEANPVTLPAPTGVTGSAVSQYSTLIKWNSVSGASGYNVYKDNARNERVLLARTLQGTTVWYDTQAVCNTTYGYYVEAFKYNATSVPIGSGNISPKVSVQTPGCTTLASVQVLTPNGGEVYRVGNAVNISWRATGLTNQSNSVSVNVYAARADKDYNSGKSSAVFGITLGNSVNGGVVSDTGSYAWTIPTYIPVGEYVVLVKSSFTSNPDISDNPFSIRSDKEEVGIITKLSQLANVLDGFNNANSAEQNPQTNANASPSCGEFNMTLSKGMVNAEVKCLQKTLIEKGFKIEGVKAGEETNYFGYNTLMALKKFQKSNQLTVDGIFGPASREAVKK